jgi:signal transduction histidine kinase
MFFARLKRAALRLSVRLTFWHSLIFLGSALVLLSLTYLLLRKRAIATERDNIEFRLYQYAGEYQNGGLASVRRLASLRKGRAQKAFFVRLADAENRTLFQRDPEDWAEFHLRKLSKLPPPRVGVRGWHTLSSPAGTEMLLAVQRLPDGSLLQLGKADDELRDLLADFRRTSLYVVLISLPLSFAGGAFLASRALRPVGLLTGVAQAIVETSRFDARVPTPGSGDELDALVQVFNKMLGRIDVLVRELRDSIDNVAHDLRTPLTRLRHIAQGALTAQQEPNLPAACPRCEASLEALAECVEETDRVTTVLNTIMDISEAEAGLVKLSVVSLSVADVTRRTVEAYAEFAEEHGVTIKCQVATGLSVRADEIALGRVLANLLDNAIKYTPAGGLVTLQAQREAEQIRISFADTGVGIPEEDLPRIWERLFRSDRSRTERGLGLGLSFVQAIVEAHGGAVAAESRLDQGTRVSLTLPAA